MEMKLNEEPNPDALMAWTTTVALIVVGVTFLGDVIAIGRVLLPLGILSAINEGIKLRGTRRGTQPQYRHVRLVLAVVYAALMALGVVVLIVINCLPWSPLG